MHRNQNHFLKKLDECGEEIILPEDKSKLCKGFSARRSLCFPVNIKNLRSFYLDRVTLTLIANNDDNISKTIAKP